MCVNLSEEEKNLAFLILKNSYLAFRAVKDTIKCMQCK